MIRFINAIRLQLTILLIISSSGSSEESGESLTSSPLEVILSFDSKNGFVLLNGLDLPIVLNLDPLKGLALIKSWIFFSTISSKLSSFFSSISSSVAKNGFFGLKGFKCCLTIDAASLLLSSAKIVSRSIPFKPVEKYVTEMLLFSFPFSESFP